MRQSTAKSQLGKTMEGRTLLVDEMGRCEPLAPRERGDAPAPYHLFRFLTEMEDALAETADNPDRLSRLCGMTRHLLAEAAWIRKNYIDPEEDPGCSVVRLYDEPDFPISVKMVAWLERQESTVHSHGTWTLVALLEGRERHVLWRREPTPAAPHRIVKADEVFVEPGDIVCYLPDAIHSVETLGKPLAISLNLYGAPETERWRFDPRRHTREAPV